jgi:hypothetical protein
MGLLDRFKKKDDDMHNLPYMPDDPSLPPLPPPGVGRNTMDLPPLPPMPKLPPGGARDLPPLPKMMAPPQQEHKIPLPIPKMPELPHLPKKVDDLPDDDFDINESLPDLEPTLPPKRIRVDDLSPKGINMAPIPEGASRRKAKVFVQLNKYKDIVKTVHNMEDRINDLQTSISKIKDIRTKENDIIESWNKLLSEAKVKIEEVNHKLPGVDEE